MMQKPFAGRRLMPSRRTCELQPFAEILDARRHLDETLWRAYVIPSPRCSREIRLTCDVSVTVTPPQRVPEPGHQDAPALQPPAAPPRHAPDGPSPGVLPPAARSSASACVRAASRPSSASTSRRSASASSPSCVAAAFGDARNRVADVPQDRISAWCGSTRICSPLPATWWATTTAFG